MIFQSIGLRLFQGIGISLLIAIFVLCLPKAKFMKAIKPFMIIEIVYLALAAIKSIEIKNIIINSAAIFDACLFLTMYRDYITLKNDLYQVLKIYCTQAFISIPVYFLIPSSAYIMLDPSEMPITPRTFVFLFYYPMEASIIGYPRISGWCWEPGTFQLVANMFLLLKIIRKDSMKSMIWVVFVILSTFSTLAYVCLLLNLVAAIWNGKRKIMMTFVIIVSIPLASGIVISNFSEKFADDNVSGLIRKRDIYVGTQIMKDHPIVGYDYDNLKNSTYGRNLEDVYWAATTLAGFTQSNNIYYAGGYTNGFFSVLMTYGLIIGILIFYCIYRSPLFVKRREKICILLFWIVSLQSEQVSVYCSFFYLFAMLGFEAILASRNSMLTIKSAKA
jgi:hypothetical protein